MNRYEGEKATRHAAITPHIDLLALGLARGQGAVDLLEDDEAEAAAAARRAVLDDDGVIHLAEGGHGGLHVGVRRALKVQRAHKHLARVRVGVGYAVHLVVDRLVACAPTRE